MNNSGTLFVKSDVSGLQMSSNVILGSAAWHSIELCGTVGTSSHLGSLSRRREDRGRLGRQYRLDAGGWMVIGDTASETFTVNIDDVVVDQTPAEAGRKDPAAD